jgi:hypothetical protein
MTTNIFFQMFHLIFVAIWQGLLIIAVISALIQSDFFEDFDSVIIALYLIVFALIIICFECCSSLCAFALATNFGFM